MTFRRILTIIIVLLVLAGILFGVSWYVSRRTAEKNGTDPLSFRQFLGIGTTTAPGQNAGGELSGEFTPGIPGQNPHDSNNNGINDLAEDRNNNGILDGNEDLNGNGILDGDEDIDGNGIIDRNDTALGNGGENDPGEGSSDTDPFTGDPLMPAGNDFGDDDGFNNGGNPGGGGNPGDNNNFDSSGSIIDGTTPTDTTDYNDPESPIGDLSTLPLTCSEEDVNIQFTAAELARLNTLQALFNNIPRLYDDAASEQQLALYSTFKAKQQQTAELVTFCENVSPLITDPKMKIRVPTPVYHDTARDSNTFTNHPYSLSHYTDDDLPASLTPLIDHPVRAVTGIERLLRINIW